MAGVISIEARAIDKLSGPFKKAALNTVGSLDSIDKKSQSLGAKLKGTLKAGAIAGLGVGAGAAAAGISIFASQAIAGANQAIQFNKALREVETIAGASKEQIALLGESAEAMSTQFGTTGQEQVNAYYQAISAGASDSAGIVRAANKLAIGGVTDLGTAIDGLTTLTGAYAESGLKAADANDIFFTAIKLGKTNAGELSSSIGKVASSFAAQKVPAEELFAAVAAGSVTMGNATKPITGLQAALSNIQKPSKGAQEEAKRLGISFSASALRSKGLKGFLDQITTSSKFTEDSIAKLFGSTEAVGVVTAITANNSKRFADNLEEMKGRAGAADKAFSVMNETFGMQIQQLNSLQEAASRAFGQLFTDTDFGAGAIQGLRQVMVVLTGFFKQFKKTAMGTAEDARDFVLGGAVVLAQGILAAVKAFSALDVAQTRFRQFLHMVTSGAVMVGTMVGRIIAGVIGAVGILVTGALSAISGFISKVANAIGVESISSRLKNISASMKRSAIATKDFTKSTVDSLKGFSEFQQEQSAKDSLALEESMESRGRAVDQLKGQLGGLVGKLKEVRKEGGATSLESPDPEPSGDPSPPKPPKPPSDPTADIAKKLGGAEAKESAKKAGVEVSDSFMGSFLVNATQLAAGFKVTEDVAPGMANLAKEQLSQVKSFASGIASSLSGTIVSAFDAMASGSKNFGQVIGDVLGGLAKQLAAAILQALFFRAILGIFGAITGGASTLAGTFLGSVLGAGLTAAPSTALGAGSSAPSASVGGFAGALRTSQPENGQGLTAQASPLTLNVYATALPSTQADMDRTIERVVRPSFERMIRRGRFPS